jgi:hypothetical protein
MSGSRTLSFWLALIRRDEAVRSLPLWLVVTSLTTSALVGVIVFRTFRNSSPQPPVKALILVLWLVISLFLVAGQVRARCSRLDLVLPIRARSLWLAHITAVLLTTSAILAASLGVVALHGTVLARAASLSISDLRLLPLAAHLLVGILLAVVITQSYKPSLRRLVANRGYFTRLLAALTGVLFLILGLGSRPALLALLAVALAALLARRTYLSLPSAMLLTPTQPASVPRRHLATDSRRLATSSSPLRLGNVGRGRSLRLFLATLYHTPPWGAATAWLFFPLVAVMGFVLSGVLELWLEAWEIRFLYIPLNTYMLFAIIGPLTYQLHRLDPLPIARRSLFALLMMPALLAFLVGYAGGRLALASRGRHLDQVEYRIEEPYYWVDVPARFMEVAWSGNVPTLSSPWGESHLAWNRPLLREGGPTLYSPFNTTEESTAAFEAMLTTEALATVHAISLSPDEILERYFEVDGKRLSGLRKGGLTLEEDYPGLKPGASGPEAPMLMALVIAPWMILSALLFRTFRAGIGARARQGFFWGALVLLLAVLLVQVAGAVTGLYDMHAAAGITEVTIRQLGHSPSTVAAAWVASLLLMTLSSWLALTQFARMEIPTKPTRFYLVAWGTEEA